MAVRLPANRVIAVIVGGGFLALGVLGTLWISRGDTPLGPAEGSLMWGVVEVSGLQNIVHLVAGLALLVSGFVGLSTARLANLLVGTLLLALGLVALFTIGSSANLLAVNGWGNAIHFAASALLLGASLGADRVPVQPNSQPSPS